ncbi:MAG: hypothetical protein V4585_05415 [Bacteroidota bacterium]|jgi:hypothetical protein
MKPHINTFKKVLFIFPLLCSITGFGQVPIKSTKLAINRLPFNIKVEGKTKNAIRWTDNLGDNIVVTTETGIYQSKKMIHENDGADAELFAFHFIVSKNEVKQTWKVYDFISDCPVDIEATFIKNTLQVTDLNNDGIAEIWLMYKTVCHGDVSPSDMKIIMYQGQQKFAVRGKNKVKLSDKESYGGEYKFDPAFNNGPKAFIEFAKNLWNKNIMQASEE